MKDSHNGECYIEIGFSQVAKEKEVVCGDVFMSKRIPEENRIVAVLSDGLGSGVRANVLATLTATMGLHFTLHRYEPQETARNILSALPVDKVRKISYSTFTLVDIDSELNTSIVNFDNPDLLFIRQSEVVKGNEKRQVFQKSRQSVERSLKFIEYKASPGDRIILVSDGVSQSGIGSVLYPFGWEIPEIKNWLKGILESKPDISAQELASRIVGHAHTNDAFHARDDISGAVIYFRRPRKLLLCTGPPFHPEDDPRLARRISEFPGQKIICGGTTAEIVGRELGRQIEVCLDSVSAEVPPYSTMEGIDLITEGVLTLGKVASRLEKGVTYPIKKNDAAGLLISYLLNNDQIYILTGTRINEAHQDPNLPVELEIRRNVVQKIKRLLEERFLKEVHVDFI